VSFFDFVSFIMIKSSVFVLVSLALVAFVHSQSGSFRIANALGGQLTLTFSDQSTLTLADTQISNYTMVPSGNISVVSGTFGNGTALVNASLALSFNGGYNTYAAVFFNGTGPFYLLVITELFDNTVNSTAVPIIRFIDLSLQFVSTSLAVTGSATFLAQYLTYTAASMFTSTSTNVTSLTISSNTGVNIATVPATLTAGFAYTVFLFDNSAASSNVSAAITMDHAFTIANTTMTTGIMTTGNMNMTNMTTGMMNMTTGMANMTTGMMANMTTGMMMNATTGMMANATTGMMANMTTGMMMNATTGMMPMNMTTGMGMMNITSGVIHIVNMTTGAVPVSITTATSGSQLASIMVGLIAFAIALAV